MCGEKQGQWVARTEPETSGFAVGVLLADDHHKPILVNGKPVTGLVKVSTR